jgi:hypothetical protein
MVHGIEIYTYELWILKWSETAEVMGKPGLLKIEINAKYKSVSSLEMYLV